MATYTWPLTLPQCPLVGMTEDNQANWANDDGEIGQGRRRARTTRNLTGFKGLRFHPVESSIIDIFEDFYENTLSNGALEFNFTHPRTKAIIEVRIAGGYNVDRLFGDLYQLSFDLEEV